MLLRVETDLEQYQTSKPLLVRIGNRTVILQYNWQSVKCQVIQEDTVTSASPRLLPPKIKLYKLGSLEIEIVRRTSAV